MGYSRSSKKGATHEITSSNSIGASCLCRMEENVPATQGFVEEQDHRLYTETEVVSE